ncbi:uncharacterized protein LOC127289835 isoform X3 [Leptopilina boulardi]|uniref:uncharacterized protein LOC127289835 isoform X3 n=1 Tax=Leptopilina boulardi TaxID=63433 RepID=UPI0021F67AC8|nr:uncharacterized protein LOC127289835 isoform X3 [Leptopilina boulardi]
MSCCDDGFRLAEAPSVCSMKSKAQIDALFDELRSICSSTNGGWYPIISTGVVDHDSEDISSEEQRKINNAVQARIESMFASVEAESGTPGECAAAILPVKYLGAAPVGGRVASVRGLQEPLRQLLEQKKESTNAELEVSRRGLTYRTVEHYEKNNPFRRIAVWSALRLRAKKTTNGGVHHAFMPLVGDDLTSSGDERHSDLYRTMRGLNSQVEGYPPIFAVVMRRPGVARLLECHAFACQAEEDAIAAAATLYRALVADLEANRKKFYHRRRPRQTNGVGCVSLASVISSARDLSPASRIKNIRRSPPPSRPMAPHPVRPPRAKKSSVSSATEEETTKKSPVVVEKVPRRKKRLTEINPDDILEARNRKYSLSKNSNIKNEKRRDTTKVEIQLNEERMNNKNKIYGTKQTHTGKIIEIPRGQADITYDDNRKCNEYERFNLKNKKKNCCHETNNQKKINENEKNEENIYEKNQGFYDLNRSAAKNREENCDRGKYKISSEMNKAPEKKDSECKSRENSIYEKMSNKRSSREKLNEEHLKNADKIYSLGQEEIYTPRKPARTDINQMQTKCIPQQEHRNQKDNASEEDIYSCRQANRISTLDKPMKKQLLQDLSTNIPQCCQRTRRRSRAGSEPPSSRSEEALKCLQETKLKRSQSDIDVDKGDLMTRVELPRRGSFLKTGSTRRPNTITGGTPLGFTELFDEFRNQEGLTSVDDILATIIDPEGMSFNDLKPLYKEFLLKLASTLTQDELYQRSASIMRRRRRPQRRRSTSRPSLLGRAIRRLGKRRSSWRKNKGAIGQTTSEDSDTCKRWNRNIGANRSSSGYVSCSECSYDSETCTCISADKCYCSLSRKVPAEQAVICSCDTDSCSESNKCYCPSRPDQPTILEQLRQRGIVPSESTISRGGSSDRAKTARTNRSIASSQSLEFLKVRPSPNRGSSDNLALDYDLFSPGRKSQHSSDSEKVLVVSARDPQGRLVYVGGTERHKKSTKTCQGKASLHHEALSIKKSAEIAAIFGGNNGRLGRKTSNASSVRSSVSLEAGLGYLP